MKIKSWTGGEVEARAGDVMLTPPDYVILERVSETDDRLIPCHMVGGVMPVYGAIGIDSFRLDHRPFQDGDLIHVNCGHNFDCFSIETYSSPEYGMVRHANPDLRTSPEYRHE